MAPFAEHEANGNSVAARRLARGFRARGAAVRQLGAPEVADAEAVAAAVRAFAPDVVLVLHAFRCATAFAACRATCTAPIVISLRGTDVNEMLDDPARHAVIAGQLDAAAGLVAFHTEARERLAKHRAAWAAKTEVVANGATLPPANGDERARFGIAATDVVCVAISGLRDVKQPLCVLPWLERLRADYPGLHWLHAGAPWEAPLATELQRWLARADWVHHVDHVPHDEIGRFLRTGDVFVSASRSEGMPHAVREAMLAGLPLLLSDIPGHRAVVGDAASARFFTDEASFAAGVRWLLAHPREAAAAAATARIRAEHELHAADEIGAYLRLLARVAGVGPPGVG